MENNQCVAFLFLDGVMICFLFVCFFYLLNYNSTVVFFTRVNFPICSGVCGLMGLMMTAVLRWGGGLDLLKFYFVCRASVYFTLMS